MNNKNTKPVNDTEIEKVNGGIKIDPNRPIDPTRKTQKEPDNTTGASTEKPENKFILI